MSADLSVFMLTPKQVRQCTCIKESSFIVGENLFLLDLKKYKVTYDEAQTFFNILALLPMLNNNDFRVNCNDMYFAIFNMFEKAIGDKLHVYLQFAAHLGCDTVSELLVKYYCELDLMSKKQNPNQNQSL